MQVCQISDKLGSVQNEQTVWIQAVHLKHPMDQAKTEISIHSLEDLTVGLARTYPEMPFFIVHLFGMCTKKTPSKLTTGVDLKNL